MLAGVNDVTTLLSYTVESAECIYAYLTKCYRNEWVPEAA